MKISPLFKWFGSKWQSAKRYPPPEHDRIVEPFAGGAGYALNHVDKSVFLWEDDPNLFALWTWLLQAKPEEILTIPLGVPVGTDIRTLGMNRGQELLLKHWQRTNNVGDCWTISPWGHLPGQWTANTRARVAEESQAIRHWRVVPPIDLVDLPCTWFIDPPYLYNYRYRKGLPDFDYDALSSLVQTIHSESLIIACEAARRSDGAIPDYLNFKPSHRSVTSRRKPSQSHHSNELTYVRRPGSAI
jgi:hypothetical protein